MAEFPYIAFFKVVPVSSCPEVGDPVICHIGDEIGGGLAF